MHKFRHIAQTDLLYILLGICYNIITVKERTKRKLNLNFTSNKKGR
nr:MAG TPA: hypothetical protein [Caudoviricetes sp.]